MQQDSHSVGREQEVVMACLLGRVGTLVLVVATLAGCSEEGVGETVAWCEVDSPSGAVDRDFTAVSFPDPLIGTVIGGIGRTTNGGVTWTTQEGPGQGSYLDVVFTDVDTGTIVGSNGTILRTTDGGDHWAAQDGGTDAALYGVSFADANTGLAVGSGGTVLRTGDGGATWVTQDSGTNVALLGVWLSDANTATAVGASGTILRTSDGGATWVPQDSGTNVTLNAVSFASINTGVAVCENGVVLRTTDGGETWTQAHDFSPTTLNDIWFADAAVGTIVGASATILRTTDGGATWASELNNADYWHWDQSLVDPVRVLKTLYGVSMADANNGVAVGEFYGIARRTTVADTHGVCDPWCAKAAECDPVGDAGCDLECLCTLGYFNNISSGCERALVDSLRCFTALTCEEIDAYFDDPDNHPCTAAEERIDMECNPAAPVM
jgi:photosystem II stability/assembly factor-like uncharacterized protein